MTDSYQFSQIYPHHHNHYNTLVPFFTLVTAFTAGICSIRHVSATPSSHSNQHQTVEKSNKTGWVEAAHACYVSFLQTVVLVVLQFWWVSISESCWVFKCLQSDGSLCVLINSIHTVTLSTACKSTSSSEQISDEFPAIKMQLIFGFVMFLSFL